MQSTDFLASFYVAGHLVFEGRAKELYHANENISLFDTPFNNYAKKLLAKLNYSAPALYFYPPPTALLFAWAGLVPPQAALPIWQAVSVFSLALCAKLLASISGKNWPDYFWLSAFCLPIIHMIAIGQVGIVIGLLPLSLGLWLLLRGRQFLAGFVFSLLLLKPQFLPVALLLVGVSALVGELSCALAFSIGALLILLGTLAYFGIDIVQHWFLVLKQADLIFSGQSSGYINPRRLIASLPAAILPLLPGQLVSNGKMILCCLSLVVSLDCLIRCFRLIKATPASNRKTPFIATFIMGICILPVIMPHFFFYELSLFVLAGMLIEAVPFFRRSPSVMRAFLFNWAVIDLYFVLIIINEKLAQPLILVISLIWLYWETLKSFDREISLQKPLADGGKSSFPGFPL